METQSVVEVLQGILFMGLAVGIMISCGLAIVAYQINELRISWTRMHEIEDYSELESGEENQDATQ